MLEATASNWGRLRCEVTRTFLGQLAYTGNDYKHAEGNWDILGGSVSILG